VNVKDVPGIVCVIVGGEDTMEYWDAYRTGFHARLTVEVVGLEAVKPTTDASCGGNIDGDTLLKVLDRVVVIVVAPETGIAKNVPSPKATEPQLFTWDPGTVVDQKIPSSEYMTGYVPLFDTAIKNPSPYETADHVSMGAFPSDQLIPSKE
jgi:hypothetical protein